MKEKYHHVIHDKLTGILLIITFTVSIFIVFCVVQVQNEARIGEDQREKEQYAANLIYQCEREDYDEDLEEGNVTELKVDKLKLQKGNVILTNIYIRAGDADVYLPSEIVLKQNEPLVEELQTGRYPTGSELMHHRNCVVIGSGVLQYVKKLGKEKVLSVDDKNYEVLGILKDTTGSGMDDRIILFYDCLYEQTKNEIDDGLRVGGRTYFTVLYGSNQGTLTETKRLENWLYQITSQAYFTKTENSKLEESYTYKDVREMQRYNTYILYVLFGFCMCSCFIVSSIWVKRRKKELVIRKAFGSGFWKIFGVLLKDVGVMIGISVLFDIVLLIVQTIITGKDWIRQAYMKDNIIYIAISVVVVLIVTMVRPIYQVVRISPAEGTRVL